MYSMQETGINLCCVKRPLCMMTTHVNGRRLEQRVVEKPRAEVGMPCGFELAGTVEGCPKRRGLEK